MRQQAAFSALLFASILLGCGSAETAREVSGTVTYRNQPLPLGAVIFVPEEGRPEPPAPIKEGGMYTVKLPPGRYRVAVVANRATSDKPLDPEDPNAGRMPASIPLIPKKYNRFDSSGIVINVPAKGDVSGDIVLQ